ncbi:hypothetical protein ACOSQ3_031757 [Xanthoceras sorbifolium]
MLSLILTGLVIEMTTFPPGPTLFILVVILSPEAPRNNVKLLVHLSKMSTARLQPLLLNSVGCVLFLLNSVSTLRLLLSSTVIMLVQHIYVSNPNFHSCMKHTSLDYHYIRDQVQSGARRITLVSSIDQLAAALTKPLPRAHHLLLCDKIGLSSRNSILRGHIEANT